MNESKKLPRRSILAVTTLLFLSSFAWADETKSSELVFKQDLVLGLDEDRPLGMIGDVAVDSKGNIYILDMGFDTVRKYDSDGTYITDVGRQGEAPGEVYSPTSLAIGPDDRVYIGGRTTIAVLESDGKPVDSIKRKFTSPVRSMRFDPAGNLYTCCIDILDQKVIHKYDVSTKEYLASFGDSYAVSQDTDTRVESVFAGGYIDVDAVGHIYYTQMAPQEVEIYDADGGLLASHKVRFDETSPPIEPKIEGGRMNFETPEALSTCVLGLAGGKFLTVLFFSSEEESERRTIVDLYDSEGTRLNSKTYLGSLFSVKAKDAQDRIYVFEDRNVPVVVRYAIASSGE